MTVNKNEVEKFFEDSREIRSLAISGINKPAPEEQKKSFMKPRYIGVYLANYYSGNINKKFHNDLLK